MRINPSDTIIRRTGSYARLVEESTNSLILTLPSNFSNTQIWHVVDLVNRFYKAGQLNMRQDMEIEARHDKAIRDDQKGTI